MVTSLGLDAATSCAAARAGLVRASPIGTLRFVSSVDGEPAPVVGHAAPVLTEGFEGAARLRRLLGRALADLGAPLGADRDGSDIGLYVSLPPAERSSTGQRLVDDEADAVDARRLDEEAESAPDSAEPESWLRGLLRDVPGLARARVRARSCLGHAGGVDCIRAALEDLVSGATRMAVVAAVDSLLDEETIEWLGATRRLKLPDMPVGVFPGEAAACLALTRCDGTPPPGRVLMSSPLEIDDATLLSGAVSGGAALARAVATVAADAGWQRSGTTAWIVSDINGEVYRAMEWGHALVRLRGAHEGLDDIELWTPAESFGDTGAASAVVSACVAMAALDRGYAPAGRAVIAATSDGRARGALLVQ